MIAKGVKAEISNLEIHMGDFSERKFKMKCDVTYEEQMLTLEGGKRSVRLRAMNIANVHLEKKALRISALNFEIVDKDEMSVASGSIRVEFGNDTEQWYKELWG